MLSQVPYADGTKFKIECVPKDESDNRKDGVHTVGRADSVDTIIIHSHVFGKIADKDDKSSRLNSLTLRLTPEQMKIPNKDGNQEHSVQGASKITRRTNLNVLRLSSLSARIAREILITKGFGNRMSLPMIYNVVGFSQIIFAD